jgi:hypothetical protein
MTQDYDSKLWIDVIETGKQIEKGDCHTLPDPFVHSIVATMDYFGISEPQMKQVFFDLKVAKYKIWDWLGMCLTGRLDAEKNSRLYECIEKMAKLYVLQKDVGGWAWWLRGHDLEFDPFECKDCCKSYKDWMNEIKSNGGNPNDYS